VVKGLYLILESDHAIHVKEVDVLLTQQLKNAILVVVQDGYSTLIKEVKWKLNALIAMVGGRW
jgi:hypothetical protein